MSRPAVPRPGGPRIGIAPSRVTRTVILVVIALLFAIPLIALVEFTFRTGLGDAHGPDHWIAVFSGGLDPSYKPLWTGIGNSLLLALLTVVILLVLLVPTMILVRLRFPRLRPVLEFVCLLPVTIPAVVLVVGLAPVYSVVARMFGSGVWTLAFAYGVLALPFAYRAIASNLAAVDVNTLAEAARTLGAGWGTVVLRVILPNLRRGLLAGAFISIAVVLGEFTIASLLSRSNLQTTLVLISKQDPYTANIFIVLSLLFAFALLLVIGRVGAAPRRNRS